jgi:hypothetical protein
VGDPIRVRSGDRESVLRIVGIFDIGKRDGQRALDGHVASQRADPARARG